MKHFYFILLCVVFQTVSAQRSLDIDMIFVEGGEFVMGKGVLHQTSPRQIVTLSSYLISKYEVTNYQWKMVMGSLPKNTINPCDDCPVHNMTWYEAQEFIEKLNKKTNDVYRLPTEAEWEYAALGGKYSKGYAYSGSNNLKEIGHCNEKKICVFPVGQKKANELGVYDMTGNVWEWCSDWYSENLSVARSKNPQGPVDGEMKVIRGGNTLKTSSLLEDRVFQYENTWRNADNPLSNNALTGIRLVQSTVDTREL
jgi:formylglycine-generating enzyme required for sulfatase activity